MLENPSPLVSRSLIRRTLLVLKPVIDSVPDPSERQRLSEALAKACRTYLATVAAKAAQDRRPTMDADPRSLGRRIYEAHNPHSETNRRLRREAK